MSSGRRLVDVENQLRHLVINNQFDQVVQLIWRTGQAIDDSQKRRQVMDGLCVTLLGQCEDKMQSEQELISLLATIPCAYVRLTMARKLPEVMPNETMSLLGGQQYDAEVVLNAVHGQIAAGRPSRAAMIAARRQRGIRALSGVGSSALSQDDENTSNERGLRPS